MGPDRLHLSMPLRAGPSFVAKSHSSSRSQVVRAPLPSAVMAGRRVVPARRSKNWIFVGLRRVGTTYEEFALVGGSIAVEANELHLTTDQLLATSGGNGLIKGCPLGENF